MGTHNQAAQDRCGITVAGCFLSALRCWVVVHARWFFICSGLLLLLTNGAYADDGIYQRTKDGKTIVWNPDPAPDDAATWSGDRDANRYASGYGTLTWYKVERKYAMGSRLPIKKEIPVIRYSGKMVQGKLSGSVVAEDPEGKTSHATFADGIRNGEWVVGPAPTPEHSPSPSYAATSSPSPTSAVTGPPSPSSGVTGRRDKPDSRADESAQRDAVAEAPVEKPSPSPPASPIPDQQRGDETVHRKAIANVPVAPAATSPARSAISEHPPISGATGSPVPSLGATRQSNERLANQPARATRGRASDFLQSLVLPPSVLGPRISFLAGTSPQPSAAATSSSMPAGPLLSTAEVIGLADAEARVQGYDVGIYQRPKVDYVAIDDTWSVVYDQKPAQGKIEGGEHFSVKVEDKTRKTSIVAGK